MKAKFFTLVCLLLLIVACAPKKPHPYSQIPALQGQVVSENSIRLTAVQDTAMSIGAQGGLAWRAHQLNHILDLQQNYLNQIFNFNSLILHHNVLPPVLAEGNDALNLADPETLRLADKVYKIVLPPRFVTTPPTWREYLWLDYASPEAPSATLLPKSAEEQQIWNKYVQVGWQDGIAQANEIFSANLGRLKRDYSGMILYQKLLRQNMVSRPFVATLNLGVTGDSRSMRINDQVLRITATSKLNTQSKTWKAVVSKGEAGGADEDADQADPR